MFKVAAEREAGIYEQLVVPLARQRNPEARGARPSAALGELADLGRTQLRCRICCWWPGRGRARTPTTR